jgi:hypothetical protein
MLAKSRHCFTRLRSTQINNNTIQNATNALQTNDTIPKLRTSQQHQNERTHYRKSPKPANERLL